MRCIVIVYSIMLALASSIQGTQPVAQPAGRVIHIGLLEGGDYAAHSAAREAFRTQLEAIAPAGLTITFDPNLFKSAEWDRQRCKTMATELAATKNIDIVLAFGPWTVQDLLEAGFSKPIVAMYQSDSEIEKLVDSTGKPRAANLTVSYDPDKLAKDLVAYTRVVKFKKLGVLYFHSPDDSTRLMDRINAIGKRLGFEAVTAEGYNNIGTFAFFKAYEALDKSVDAVYLLPMWGMDSEKMRELSERLVSNRHPSMGAESRFVVERGLLVSATASSFVANGRFDAWKALRIINGEAPASLPTHFPDEQVLTINERTASRLKIYLPIELSSQAELVGNMPDPAQPPLTLNDALQRAHDQNPGYLAKYEAMSEATARAADAWTAYLPQLSLQGDVAHLSDNAVSNDLALINAPQIAKADRMHGSLVLDQQVFSLATIRAVRASGLARRLSEISKDQAARDLDAAVTAAFLDYLRITELDATYRRQRQLADANIEIARAKAATGEAPDLEVNRWRAERLLQSNRLLATRAAVEASRILVNSLLNQAGTTPLSLDTTVGASGTFWEAYSRLRPFVSTDIALRQTQERLTATALQDNPAMRSSRTGIELQNQRIRQNTANWLPTVGLRAALNVQDQYRDFRPIFEEKGTSWTISAGLRWSLFDGGHRLRDRRALIAQLNGDEYRRDSLSLELMQRVSSSLARLAGAEAQVAASERLYEMAKAQITSVLDLYAHNKVGYLEPLDAARLAEQAQENLLNARFAFFSAATTLTHDLGWSAFDANTTPVQLLISRLETSEKSR